MQLTEQKEEYWAEDKTGKILLQTSIRGKPHVHKSQDLWDLIEQSKDEI